jgi:hypothetical protein
MFLTVDVLGQKVDVLVVDVLEVDVLEVVQMGRPGIKVCKNKETDLPHHI